MSLPLILVGVASLGMVALLIYYFATKKAYSKNSQMYTVDKIQLKNKSTGSDIFDRVYQVVYNAFVTIPVISYYTKKTRLKMEMVNDYTEYEIRKQTGKNMLFMVLFTFVTIGILINLIDDLYMTLAVILGILIVVEKIVDMRITKVSDRILRQMPDVFTNVRHAFHEHGMIEESFLDTIDELGDKEIVPQLKRMLNAMMAEDANTELEKYYDTAPNRFLKLFAGISYLTLELGDRKVEGTSVYLKNLNNILSDIYLELIKKEKMDNTFRSLTVIAVCPIVFMNPLRAWAEGSFPSLINFYNSTTGFIIECLIVVSIFVCYLMLRIIKEDTENIKFDRVASIRWQDKIYKNVFVKAFVDTFKPRAHTKKERQVTYLIKNTNSYLTIEWLYINKIVTAFGAFVAVLVLIFNLQFINFNAIYNSISEEFLSFGTLSPQNQAAAEALNKADREIVQKYTGKSLTRAELANELGSKYDDDDLDRIMGKINKINNNFFKWWELLICIGVALIGYMAPTVVLFVRNKMREMEKQNEIMQFQSIILMLMYIERVDVQTILEWLARFSYAFKEPISTCLNNYESGAWEALEQLKDDVPHKEFQRIVEQLQTAVEKIPIRSAFDELETERTYYYDKRKEAIEVMIQKKSTLGKALGFTPMVILIAGYLVAPLLVVSMMQMMNYFTMMT